MSEAATTSLEQKGSFQKALQEVSIRVKVLLQNSANFKRELDAAKTETAEATQIAHDAVMERVALERSFDDVKHQLATVQEEKQRLMDELAQEKAAHHDSGTNIFNPLEDAAKTLTKPRRRTKTSGKRAGDAQVKRAEDFAASKRPSSSLSRWKKRKILAGNNTKSGSSKPSKRAPTALNTDDEADDDMFEDSGLLR